MTDIVEYIDRFGRLRKFDVDDRLGVYGPKYCGYPDCTEVTEPGYGRCAYHLKLDEESNAQQPRDRSQADNNTRDPSRRLR